MHRMYRWPFVRHIENSVHARCWGLQQASKSRAAGLDATGLGATGLGGTHACGAGQADNSKHEGGVKNYVHVNKHGFGLAGSGVTSKWGHAAQRQGCPGPSPQPLLPDSWPFRLQLHT